MSVQFELSRNPDWLAEYYRIREYCFRQDLGLISFDGSEDEFDRTGLILIARDGDHVVGGARISGKAGPRGLPLPMEREGMALDPWFPQLRRQELTYCQWTRMALLPGYRTVDILREACRAMIEVARREGYAYAFNIAGMNRARLYKRLHSNLGVEYRILEQVPVPVERGFHGLPHLLSVTALEGVAAPALSGRALARVA